MARVVVSQSSYLLSAVALRALEDAGLGDVTRAVNLAGALEACAGEGCGVLVTDWVLEDAAGADLLARVASLPRRPYTLVLTASNRPDDAVAALEAGADDHLSWPFRPAELVARVRAGLRIADLTARLAAEAADHRALVEGAADAIVVMDESGTIESANAAVEGMLGWTPGELVGMPVTVLMGPADGEAHQAHVARRLAGGPPTVIGRGREVTAIHRDGHPVPVHLAVSEATSNGRRRFCGVLRDLSELRTAEADRRTAEGQFRLLAENASDIIARLSPTGRLLYVSPACERILGYPPQELVGRPASYELVHPDDMEQLAACHGELLRGGGPTLLVHRHRTRSGGWVWLETLSRAIRDESGAVVEIQTDAREVTGRVRAEAEQQALRRVALAVAHEPDLGDVLDLVAREVRGLLVSRGALVAEMADRGQALVRALTGVTGVDRGGRLRAARILDRMARRRAPFVATWTASRRLALAPVEVRGRLWGVVGAVAPDLDADTAERLVAFAHLVSTAVTNAESRARLEDRAARDPLTGLLNHAAFHERLGREVERASAQGVPLAVAILDVDNFKGANDTLGHQTGDRLLQVIARRLAEVARAGEVLGRIGGDEFAWILPGADEWSAHSACDRARTTIGARPVPDVGRVSLSAGVATTAHAGGAADLVRLADGALYWAKAHGRDQTCSYHPENVSELSAHERAERLARSQALNALKALARAVDAKDPSTARHSERVAVIAVALGERLGWGPDALRRLREAALLHDVGKIGVPDLILSKPGPLTPEEYAQVQGHAALGSEIVAESLDSAQVAWVRGHHERWDGAGYPDRLAGDDIPEGARVLALADVLEVLTGADRPYRQAIPWDEALEECRRCAGGQFWPEAVDALDGLPLPVVAPLTGARTGEASASRRTVDAGRSGAEPGGYGRAPEG